MGIGYYTFALFAFLLVCVVLCVARLLFGGGKQRGKLDEKEQNLIDMYREVEGMINDLYDRMLENAAEFQRIENLRESRHALGLPNLESQNGQTGQSDELRRLESLRESHRALGVPGLTDPESQADELRRLESLRILREKAAQLNAELNIPPEPEPSPPLAPNKAAIAEAVAAFEANPGSAAVKRDTIVALIASGMTDRQIADKLGITLSETRLVRGLYKSP